VVFILKLKRIQAPGEKINYPLVIESSGQAPSQYGEEDEEF